MTGGGGCQETDAGKPRCGAGRPRGLTASEASGCATPRCRGATRKWKAEVGNRGGQAGAMEMRDEEAAAQAAGGATPGWTGM